MRKLLFVGAAMFASWSAPLARATPLLSDAFNYPDGPLVTVSGGAWVHHSGTTTGEVKVVSGRVFLAQTNSEDVNALLQGQPYPPSTNILLYASFTINFASFPSGAGTYFAHFKDAGTTGFRAKVFATTNSVPAGFFRVGIANSSNSPTALISSNLTLNTDYLLVTRYAPSNATSALWLNPVAETNATATATDNASTITVVAFALRESLSNGDGMGSLYFDNLLVGTSFDDVVSSSAPPAITTQPQNQTVAQGSNATFFVSATGSLPLSFQWQFYGTNLDNATNASLTLTNVTSDQAGPYAVIITNSFGSTNSQTATLTVIIPPDITDQPQSQTVSAGANVTFGVTATGTLPLSYQWQFNTANLAGATDSVLTLTNVSTSQAGPYMVTITNAAGSTNSQIAFLTVTSSGPQLPALSYLTYNVKGNGATNWTTNAVQVQAIGHEVAYLQPDIITFNEIPNTFTYEMTNFVTAFLPGYYLATNSATDGFIRSVIASRFPILSSKSYLHSADLNPYGYTNANFTRDLFQARISVPNFPQPLNVFVVHLKSGQDADSSARRAAEASAVSNFFVTVFLPTNTYSQPYVLSGDMNEDINSPPPSNPQSIQRLENAATGLRLTTPVNPFTGSALTFSIQNTNGLSKRYDYVMPYGLLFSNITSSQVFRTDLLSSPPPPLLTTDDKTASDHLPVLMVFSNPYNKPFRLTSIIRSNPAVAVTWQSVPGQVYRVEGSPDLSAWATLANNLTATGASYTFTTNLTDPLKFLRVYRFP